MHALLLSLALLAPLGQEEAVVHWNAGRRTQAIEAWSAQLQAAPQDAVLRRRLAEAQLEVHAYSAALETLAPLGPEVSALRGMAYYRSSRFEEAIDQLDRGVPEQLIMRIECLDALGRSAEVEADVERAAQLLGADHPRVLVYRARALAGADRHAEAVELFERARKLDPFDPGALFGLGRSLVAAGRREEGLARLQQHRELTPRLDALDFAERGVDLAPLHGPNHAAVGDAERELGRLDRARAAYELGIALAHDDQVVPIALRLARLLSEDQGELDAAVTLLETTGMRTADPRPWVRAGDLLQGAGRSMDAIQRYYKARELRPDDPAIATRIEAAHAAYRKEPKR